MIRLTYVLRRRPEMDRRAFQDYWRSTHGPLVASFAEDLRVLRYVQVHSLDDPMNDQMSEVRGGTETPYDGVAELWWRDRADLVTALESAEGQAAGAALLEDERRFINLPSSPLWLNHEYPQVNPTPEHLVATATSPIVKLFFCLRPVAGRSEEDVQAYWRTSHGALIRSHAPAMRVLRYLQVHRYEDELEAVMRTSRGTEVEPYTGHAELWFDRGQLAMSRETPEAAVAGAAAVEDEAKFIDFSRSALWIAKEHVFIDRR